MHRWFVSISRGTFVDDPSSLVVKDVGIKHLAITSEGQYFVIDMSGNSETKP